MACQNMRHAPTRLQTHYKFASGWMWVVTSCFQNRRTEYNFKGDRQALCVLRAETVGVKVSPFWAHITVCSSKYL